MRVRHVLAAVLLALVACVATAADLTIGLGTDVTSIDPHYHNLTPNNNVAQHVFGYLVERNEKSQLEPGPRHRVEDRSTRRRGSSSCARASSSTTAATSPPPTSSRRSSACRRCPNSPSPFTAYTKQIVKMEVGRSVHDPLQDGDAVSADAVGHDAGRRSSRTRVEAASTDDFNSGKAAIGTGPYKLVRYAKGDRIELARIDATGAARRRGTR